MGKFGLGLAMLLLLGACAAEDVSSSGGVDDPPAAALGRSVAADEAAGEEVATTLGGETTEPTDTTDPTQTTDTTSPDGPTSTTIAESASTSSTVPTTTSTSGTAAETERVDRATLEALLPTTAQLDTLGLGSGWTVDPVTVEPARAPNTQEPLCGQPDPGRGESISTVYSHPELRFISIMLGPSLPESVATIANLATCSGTGLINSGRSVPGANGSVIATSEEGFAALFATFNGIDVAFGFVKLDPEDSTPGDPAILVPTAADLDLLAALAAEIGANAD